MFAYLKLKFTALPGEKQECVYKQIGNQYYKSFKLSGVCPGLTNRKAYVVPEEPEPTLEPKPEPTPEPKPEPTPEPKPEPTPEPKPNPKTDPIPEPKPDPVDPSPIPEPDNSTPEAEQTAADGSVGGVEAMVS
jgi:outer membrane biosynthesis protein TonB